MVIYKQDAIVKMREVEFKPIKNGVAIWINSVECGYITYGVVKDHMEINDVYINENFRGKGYAKQLVWYALSTEGLEEVRLYPHPSYRLEEKVYLNKEQLEAFFSNFRFGELGNLMIILRL